MIDRLRNIVHDPRRHEMYSGITRYFLKRRISKSHGTGGKRNNGLMDVDAGRPISVPSYVTEARCALVWTVQEVDQYDS